MERIDLRQSGSVWSCGGEKFGERASDPGGSVCRQQLTLADREEISRGLAMGIEQKDIALLHRPQ